MKQLETKKQIENYALRRLASQEWSYYLLEKKILERCDDKELVEEVLTEFMEKDWLSDERFAECYIRSTRDNKGYGPIKIRARLQEKGVSSHIIDKHLHEDHAIWSKNAFEIRLKKYGELVSDAKEKNRQSNFLQSRGFNFSQIKTSFCKDMPEWCKDVVKPEDENNEISLEEVILKIEEGK